VIAAPGATPQEWGWLDMMLGLGANLLPCVPASPDVKCVPGSALEGKVGKIPSMFDSEGLAHGLKDWQKRPIMGNEVSLWSTDGRYNACVRLGKISGVYAIDVDVDDLIKCATIQAIIENNGLNNPPRRTRENSHKFLVPFRMEESCKKRIIKLNNEPKGPRIELLADGQQFVAVGSHSSGVRYVWPDGLPTQLPLLKLDQLNRLWVALSAKFGIEVGSKKEISSPSLESPVHSELLTSIPEPEWLQLRSALRYMLDKVNDNDSWSEIGYALLSLRATRPARELFIEWSRKAWEATPKAGPYQEGEAEKWWKAHEDQQPRSDYRHIFTIARSSGWTYTTPPDAFQPVPDLPAESKADPPLPDKPVIRVVDAALPDNVKQIEELIEPEVYMQGNMHVRLSREHRNDVIRRSESQVILIPSSAAWLQVRSTELAHFQKWDGRSEDWRDIACPRDLALTVLGQGDSRILRPLEAIARAPFVREDGSICDELGYDPISRTLYIPNAVYPTLPKNPTPDDAALALDHLLVPFAQFPYITGASRSAFASHILSEAARLAVDRVPMFWYTAPDAGTGKTLLSEMAAMIVHGTEPAVRPWVSDGDEIRKTLFASLLAGDRSIAFDNLPSGYKARAPELCAFLTSAIWKDRKLGVSETHAVRNRAVVSASGNNVTPVSDMARRSLVVRLDANSNSMRERRFDIADLRGYILKHRTELLVDALTIITAYNATPGIDITPLPSFERWTQLCCAPLIWLDMPDPRETQKTETDDETGSVSGIFERLAAAFGDREFTAMDIARLAGSIADTNGDLVAMMIGNGCQEPHSAQKVGYWLREQRDKIGANLKLTHAPGRDRNGARWVFKRMNQDLT